MKVDLTKEELRWLSGDVELALFNMRILLKHPKELIGWEDKHINFLKRMQKKLDNARGMKEQGE